jgi:cytochrome c oxidase assembly factor CtaG/putative copper export protein
VTRVMPGMPRPGRKQAARLPRVDAVATAAVSTGAGTGPGAGSGASQGGDPGARPPTSWPGSHPARMTAVVVAVLAAGAAGATAVAGLVSAATVPPLLGDPGPVIRWGLLLDRGIGDLAAALTVGSLLLAAVALPVGESPGGERPGDRAGGERPGRPIAHGPALLLASGAAAVWALAALTRLVLGYASLSGQAFDDPGFGRALAAYATDLPPGQQAVAVTVLAALVSVLAAAARSLRSAGLLTLLALAGLVPASLSGHAAGTSNHETAITAVGLHLVGVSVWFGGLAALVALAPGLPTQPLATSTRRFSTLAGWSLVAVAGSGAISAVLRVGDLAGLGSRYGAVLVAKVVLLAGLAGLGLTVRRRALPALEAGARGAFARIAALELALMAAALGAGAALAVSTPPVPQVPPARPTLAQSITGYRLPPPLEPSRWLSVWQPDLWWLLVAALLAGLYLTGLRRLHTRGDHWPVGRAVCWFLGVAVLVYLTSGPPAAYGRVLFSAHMVGHMAMSMLAPPLLVLGAPVTLALRALTARTDGSRGAREWVLAVVHSRYLRVMSFAPVAAVLFAGSLIAFYYTDLFGLALRTHLGHELMHTHFLLAGYLFAWVLIGIDPGPARPPYPLRLVLLLATMGFHAFFGVTLMSASTVLQGGYFGGLGRTWGADLLTDQKLGGGIAWGIGELPTLALAVVLAFQWARQDDRDARRQDRAAVLDGDAELTAYNAMLHGLAARDTASGRDRGASRDSNEG